MKSNCPSILYINLLFIIPSCLYTLLYISYLSLYLIIYIEYTLLYIETK